MCKRSQRQYRSPPAPICCGLGSHQAYRVCHFMGGYGGDWVVAPIHQAAVDLKPLCGAGLRRPIDLSSAIPIPFCRKFGYLVAPIGLWSLTGCISAPLSSLSLAFYSPSAGVETPSLRQYKLPLIAATLRCDCYCVFIRFLRLLPRLCATFSASLRFGAPFASVPKF